MTEAIGTHPLWRLVFDKDGDINPESMATLIDGIRSTNVTDVVMFSHGWNNDEATANSLYDRWFNLLARSNSIRTVRSGLSAFAGPRNYGVTSPYPTSTRHPRRDNGGGAAAVEETARDRRGHQPSTRANSPTSRTCFPTAPRNSTR